MGGSRAMGSIGFQGRDFGLWLGFDFDLFIIIILLLLLFFRVLFTMVAEELFDCLGYDNNGWV